MRKKEPKDKQNKHVLLHLQFNREPHLDISTIFALVKIINIHYSVNQVKDTLRKMRGHGWGVETSCFSGPNIEKNLFSAARCSEVGLEKQTRKKRKKQQRSLPCKPTTSLSRLLLKRSTKKVTRNSISISHDHEELTVFNRISVHNGDCGSDKNRSHDNEGSNYHCLGLKSQQCSLVLQ